MNSDLPTPPSDLPKAVIETFEKSSPNRLREIAQYVEAVAEHKERESRLAEGSGEVEPEAQSDDRPEDVPPKAGITIKEINDNRYYYWQWRDGDSVKSKYKGPVTSDK